MNTISYFQTKLRQTAELFGTVFVDSMRPASRIVVPFLILISRNGNSIRKEVIYG